MKKLVVGQTLYSLNVGNAARGKEQSLTPVKVTKIGRKYFTVEGGHMVTQFHINSWKEKTNYSIDQKLYETEQSYLDESEGKDICKRIGRSFQYGNNSGNISLEDLRKIDRIISGDRE